jgi:hypothetical protein
MIRPFFFNPLFVEKSLDAADRHRHLPSPPQRVGNLLQAPFRVLDQLDQHPHARLCAQGGWRLRGLLRFDLEALLLLDGSGRRQVTEASLGFDPLQLSRSVKWRQNGITGMVQSGAQLAGRQAGGTPGQKMFNGGNEVALSGKTDFMMPPKAIAVEFWDLP